VLDTIYFSFTMNLFYLPRSFYLPIQNFHFILLESKYSFSLWLITYIIKKIQFNLNYKIWVLHHLHCLSKISMTIQASFYYLNWTYILKLLVTNGREDHIFIPYVLPKLIMIEPTKMVIKSPTFLFHIIYPNF
jgi:hypothetical protein